MENDLQQSLFIIILLLYKIDRYNTVTYITSYFANVYRILYCHMPKNLNTFRIYPSDTGHHNILYHSTLSLSLYT